MQLSSQSNQEGVEEEGLPGCSQHNETEHAFRKAQLATATQHHLPAQNCDLIYT